MEQMVNKITSKRNGDVKVVDGKISNGCIFENTLMGIGTLIIDQEFIDEMINLLNDFNFDKNFINFISYLNNKINEYFCSESANDLNREDSYDNNLVFDEYGMILGTKMSSLKGKNIALCSEKSIAMYIILKYLYENNKITRSPSLIVSNLGTVSNPEKQEPHAFVCMDKETDVYPLKHLLLDIQNPTEVETKDGKIISLVGLYSLSEEEKEKILEGYKCSPTSLFEITGYGKEIGEKRIYGLKERKITDSFNR